MVQIFSAQITTGSSTHPFITEFRLKRSKNAVQVAIFLSKFKNSQGNGFLNSVLIRGMAGKRTIGFVTGFYHLVFSSLTQCKCEMSKSAIFAARGNPNSTSNHSHAPLGFRSKKTNSSSGVRIISSEAKLIPKLSVKRKSDASTCSGRENGSN